MNFSTAADQRLLGLRRQLLLLVDVLLDVGVLAGKEAQQSLLELADPLHRHVVHVPLGAREDGDHLLREGHWRVGRLLEELGHALAAVERGAGALVEVGSELREGLELVVLGEVELELAGDLLHRLGLGGRADARHRDADVDRGPDAGVEEVGLQEDLAVGDGDDVGGDVRRHVVGLGLDDRQRGERATALVVAHAGRALEQAGVQVEHVTGVRLTGRRSAQQQRELAVRLGVLAEVVVDDQRVLALLHEVLAHRAAGVGRHELHRARGRWRWRRR